MISQTTKSTRSQIANLFKITREQQHFSQLVFWLENNVQVRAQLRLFEKFLQVRDLKIINCRAVQSGKQLELTINTVRLAEVKSATNLAYDFFKSAVIGFKQHRSGSFDIYQAA